MVQQDRRDTELRRDRRARGRRDRSRQEAPNRSASGEASATIPAVAVDRELEPDRPDEPRIEDEQAEHGGGEDRGRRAGSADEHADQREARHHAGAEHRRLGAR